MSGNPTCENCGRNYVVGYTVKDEIWAKLPKKWNEHSSLCIECFLWELQKTAPKQKLGLKYFYFLSLRGDFSNPEFGGPIIMNDYGKNRRIYLGD